MYYNKPVMRFALLLSCIFIFQNQLKAQHFYNLDFKSKCDSSKTSLCYWDLSWGAKGSVSQYIYGKENYLLMQGASQNDVSFTEQSSILSSSKGIQIIAVSAFIRSENIEGKGAGLDIQLFDRQGQLLAFKDMGSFYSVNWVQGTSSWKKYSLSLVCPQETYKIKIGAILYGKGKAWFKNYKVSLLPIAGRKASKLAIKYISAACDTIQKHSLVKDSVNMPALKQIALKIAGNALTYRDCYLAVNYLLESLRPYGDEHSFFMTPEEVKNLESGGSLVSKIENPSHKIIDSCGYIFVPPFHGTNMELKLRYADSLQMAIRYLNKAGIKGWIIDLRENTGGDMEPMIMGLGPLFSSVKLGSLVDINNQYDDWNYKDGKYFWSTGYSSKVLQEIKPYKKLPIAVLISNKTGSSGETVVISFIGNEKTKSFGKATWGLTTGNGSFDLMDGANIHLASTVMADNTGKKYYGPIQPDYLIEENPASSKDAVIEKAVDWIRKNFQ